MANEYINPQGYNLGGEPTNSNPFWSDPKFNLDTDLAKRVTALEGEVEDIQKDLRNLGEEINDLDVITNRHTNEITSLQNKTKLVDFAPVCAYEKKHFEILSSDKFSVAFRWDFAGGGGPYPGLTVDSGFSLQCFNYKADQSNYVDPKDIKLTDVKLVHDDVYDYDYVMTTFELTISGGGLSCDFLLVYSAYKMAAGQ